MLIKLNTVIQTYGVNPIGIIHIGAHHGQEYDAYIKSGVEKVIWIESNPTLIKGLEKKIDGDQHMKVINALISDKDNEQLTFYIMNSDQASSILELEKCKQLFPGIHVNDTLILSSTTIDTLIDKENINMSEFNFLNIDIQGAELLALKGASKALSFIDAVYTEINTDYVYKNCALISEIDDYLSKFGFSRVATKMWSNHPWGDALYTKTIKI